MRGELVDWDRYELLQNFLSIGLAAEWEEQYLDPEQAIFDARANTVGYDEGWTDEQLLREFDDLVREFAPDRLDEALWDLSTAQLPGMDGVPRSVWLDYIRETLGRAARPQTPRQPIKGNPMPALPWTSLFDDDEVANWASTMVIRQHEPTLRAFFDDALGVKRVWCYGQVDRQIGEVKTAESTTRATAAVVTWRWRPDRGMPMIATAYPEIDLPKGPRQRWPQMSWLLGGYFGQDWRKLDATVWQAECHWQTVTEKPVKARVAAQLRELLATTADTDLGDTVTALGCYVLPTDLRGWLTRIANRIDRTELWRDPARVWRAEPSDGTNSGEG